MISVKELRKIAKARLKDSEILFRNRRYDGSIYLCGYAVEIALKARICKTLRWSEFPATKKEFENLNNFKTHNLDVLLKLSGVESKIKGMYMTDWSIIAQWDPEVRYKPIGTAEGTDAQNMISASKNILGIL